MGREELQRLQSLARQALGTTQPMAAPRPKAVLVQGLEALLMPPLFQALVLVLALAPARVQQHTPLMRALLTLPALVPVAQSVATLGAQRPLAITLTVTPLPIPALGPLPQLVVGAGTITGGPWLNSLRIWPSLSVQTPW